MTTSAANGAGRILLFGTYQAQDHPRIKVLAEGLAAHGYTITEVNEPLGLSTAERVSVLRQPWRLPLFAARVLGCWWRLWRRGRLVRGKVDAVLVGYLGHFDVRLARWLFRGVPIMLDHLIFAAGTAVDRGVRPGLRTRLLHLLDRQAMQCADVIIVDTAEHAERVPDAFADRVVVCLVGADQSWFAARPRIVEPALPGPLTVVFVGLYTPLQGAPTIAAALARLADRHDLEITMVGHGQEYPDCRELVPATLPVTWLEWVPPDELPGLVARHDVALGIFGTTDKAARVVPNKVYQGAAVGNALITADTPAQRRVLRDAVLYVPPGDPVALADELADLAGDRSRVVRLQCAARNLADQTFTPGQVAGPLAERIAAWLTRRPSRR